MKPRREQLAVSPLSVRIPQAVAMLGIGRSKLYQCIAAGEIDTIKIGRATLIPVGSLVDFLALRRERSSLESVQGD